MNIYELFILLWSVYWGYFPIANLPGVGTFLSGLTKHELKDEDFPKTATRPVAATPQGVVVVKLGEGWKNRNSSSGQGMIWMFFFFFWLSDYALI